MSHESHVPVDLGVKHLRPWVQSLIDEAVEAEKQRADGELKMIAEEMQKMLHRTLQQTAEAFEKALQAETNARQQQYLELTARLKEDTTEMAGELRLLSERLTEEERKRKASMHETHVKVSEDLSAAAAEQASSLSKLSEQQKALEDEVRRQKSAASLLENEMTGVKKETKERLQEVEGRMDGKLANTKEELTRQAGVLNGKLDEVTKELSRSSKAWEVFREEERSAIASLLAEQKRVCDAALAKESSARKADLMAVEEKMVEDGRRRQDDLSDQFRQQAVQVMELDGRLTKEVRHRSDEAAELRMEVEQEASIRKELQASALGIERRLVKHMEAMASHKAAVNAALGSKGSAQDMIAVAQALEQKARESDDKLLRLQEKLAVCIQEEKKARKESTAAEQNARRSEIAELGSAVGMDVAKLHDMIAQKAAADKKSRDQLDRKVEYERLAGEKKLSAEISKVSDVINEQRGHLDAYCKELSNHSKSVNEALGSKGSATDLIAVAQALEHRSKASEKENQAMRKELEDRYNKLAAALRESANALHEEHQELARKVHKALRGKGDSKELISVNEALEASREDVGSELAKLSIKLDEFAAEAATEREHTRAAMQSHEAELSALMDSKASKKDLAEAKVQIKASLDDFESNLSQTDMGLNALKEAVDSHADSMDAFTADMASSVAKKLSAMQKAIDSKADLAAAAACVHVHTYLKDKGIKTPSSKKAFGGDSARLSMDEISDLAMMQASKSRRSPSRTPRSTSRINSRRGVDTKLDLSPARRSSLRSLYTST
mmetsp:Transcript_19753/g.54874  ORF Transcript_19753/g.54874 Transcript_19753/m.54874 type:complete len:787 (+) Transcript_19753:275-2635(+)